MKKALFYTIRRNLHNDVVAITSVRERGYRKGWNGRYHKDNCPTHGRPDQFMGRFSTLQEAEAAREDLDAIRTRYEKRIEPLQKEIIQLHRDERDEIHRLFTDR
jgi:hypothetical protein